MFRFGTLFAIDNDNEYIVVQIPPGRAEENRIVLWP